MIITSLSYYVVVTGVGQCVMTELAATPSGPPARACLSVPGDIAWDDCECGSFTQSVNTWLWSNNARDPITLIGDDNTCRTRYLGVEVNAVVLRCAPQPEGGALAPTCTALDAAAQTWHRDAFALRRGIACCLNTMYLNGTVEAWQITEHARRGPQGGCVGSELTYRFWLPNCDCL